MAYFLTMNCAFCAVYKAIQLNTGSSSGSSKFECSKNIKYRNLGYFQVWFLLKKTACMQYYKIKRYVLLKTIELK